MKFTCTDGSGSFSIANGHSVVIGRSPDADVTIPHPALSRRHIRLWAENDRFFVEQLDNRGPVTVNNEVLGTIPRPLNSGDTIMLAGGLLLKVVSD